MQERQEDAVSDNKYIVEKKTGHTREAPDMKYFVRWHEYSTPMTHWNRRNKYVETFITSTGEKKASRKLTI